MNVNIPIRLPENVITSLKELAVGKNTSVSKILAEAMQNVLDGQLSIVDQPIPTKTTSICIEHAVAEQFKRYADENHIPINRAFRLLAEKLAIHDNAY